MQRTKMLKITEDIKISFHSESRCESLELVWPNAQINQAVEGMNALRGILSGLVPVEAGRGAVATCSWLLCVDQGVFTDVEG